MRTHFRKSLFTLSLVGICLVAGAHVASAQTAPSWSRTPRSGSDQSWSHTPPAGQAAATRTNERAGATTKAQPAQTRSTVIRQYNSYRPYVGGYYYPYTYGYYGYPAYPYWPGNTVSSGGPYYQYQMPNPYAFGSAFTYGYPTPGGYHYYYPW